jgi:hypothetical protein
MQYAHNAFPHLQMYLHMKYMAIKYNFAIIPIVIKKKDKR